MKSSLAILALLATALTACASTGMSDTDKLALYRSHAGARVDSFHYFGQINGWTSLGDSAIAVWTKPNEAWLLDLAGRCPDIEYTPVIGVTSQFNRVSAKFDKVIARGQRLDGPSRARSAKSARSTSRRSGVRKRPRAISRPNRPGRNRRACRRRRRTGTSPSRPRGTRGASGSSGDSRFSLISMVWCASHAAHAGLPMCANTRLPSAPGQGTKSRPSASLVARIRNQRCGSWRCGLVVVMAELRVEQCPDRRRDAERGQFAARHPAQVVIVAHRGARGDVAPAQRLQVEAVVGEAVRDRCRALRRCRNRRRYALRTSCARLRASPLPAATTAMPRRRPAAGAAAGRGPAHRAAAARARCVRAAACRVSASAVRRCVRSRSATQSPCSGHSTQAGSWRVHRVAPKSICAWV